MIFNDYNAYCIFFHLVAIYLAVTLSLQSLEESREFPVQTIIDTVPISEVPFPAVTVSPHDFEDDWAVLR